MLRRDADQLSDPVVLLWDAVASGQSSPEENEHAEVFTLISEFHAIDDAPMPDAAFLNRLEGQVIGAGTRKLASPEKNLNPLRTLFAVPILNSGWRRGIPEAGSTLRRRLSGYGRWVAAQAAIVLLLVIAIGSIGIIYLTNQSDDGPTIPAFVGDGSDATPQPGTARTEMLTRFFANPDAHSIGKPEDWNQVYFELGHVEPGDTYDMGQRDIACCRPGLAALYVTQGSMSVQLSGPANVIRSGQDPASPEVHAALTPISLDRDDTIWYGVEAHPVVTNSGSDRLIFLGLAALQRSIAGEKEGARTAPGYLWKSGTMTTGTPILQPGNTSTSIQRIELHPEDVFHFTLAENQYAIALIEAGFAQFFRDSGNRPPPPSLIHSRGPGQGIAFHEFSTGDYTLENARGEPAVVYLRTMSNMPETGASSSSDTVDTPATPQASDVLRESLLTAVVDPGSVGAESQSAWQTAALTIVKVTAGKAFTLDESNWDSALDAFVVLDGAISVESGSPSQLIQAGTSDPAPLEAGVTATLSPGDSWLAGIGTSFTVGNSGPGEAKLLMFHHGIDRTVFGFGAGTTGTYPENFKPNDVHAEDSEPLTYTGPVSLTLERVTVNKDEAFQVDVVDGEMLLLFNEDGRSFQAMREVSARAMTLLGGSALYQYGPGTYTLSVLYGDKPLILYIGRMSAGA
ncbi:hypothetical protein BH20CHL4_BH20CHL4_08520 [soil metagenome]